MTAITIARLRAPQAKAAASRSRLYAWLAAALAFPQRESFTAVRRRRNRAALKECLKGLPFPLALPLDTASALLTDATAYDDFQAEYIRLFEVGVGKPPCPPYEGIVRGGRMKVMEEVVRFYEHFGLQGQPGELPDHLVTELEFMHYLSFKEAAALQAGEDASPYRRAQGDFLARHLCRWLPRLGARLALAQASPFFLALGHLATEFCRGDRAYLEERSVGENLTTN